MRQLAFVSALVAACPAVAAEDPSAWTVRDSIEMRTIEGPLVPGPGGKYWAFVCRQGNLSGDNNHYTLWLARAGFPPQLIDELSSRGNIPAISGVRWLGEHRLVYLREDRAGIKRLASLDFHSGGLSFLSDSGIEIEAFDMTPDGSSAVLLSRERAVRNSALVSVTYENPADLLISYARGELGTRGPVHRLLLWNRGGETRKADPPQRFALASGASPRISADGRKIAFLAAVAPEDAPDTWRRSGIDWLERALIRGARRSLRQWVLWDHFSGKCAALVDSPAAWESPQVVFDSEGRTALLLSWPAGPSLVRVDLATGRSETLVAHCRGFEQSETDVVVARTAAEPKRLRYRKGTGWQEEHAPASPDPFILRIDQSINRAPRVVDSNGSLVYDPNPQFAGKRFARVEPISWGPVERRTQGGLYLPPNSTPPWPLVIQTHGWDPERFAVDGDSTAGYAAQALAARGIAVVQMQIAGWELLGTPSEGPDQSARFESLVDYLANERNLIDPARVALLGWSRTGFHVRHAITFSRIRFAAAVIADGMDISYGQYLFWPQTEMSQLFEDVMGGHPFGDNSESWRQNATAFNLERIRTPVRILAFRPVSLLNNWEWCVGLRRLGKPVDFIWMPHAAHAPVLPSERMEAQENTLRWLEARLGPQRAQP